MFQAVFSFFNFHNKYNTDFDHVRRKYCVKKNLHESNMSIRVFLC